MDGQGTSVAFDDNGCGYRKLTIDPQASGANKVVQEYIELPNGGGAPGCVKAPPPQVPIPDECAAALLKACSAQRQAGSVACIDCLEANNAKLLKANCTATEGVSWCSA